MTFDDDCWDCGDALVNIFFSDWDELKSSKNRARRKKVGTELLCFLSGPIRNERKQQMLDKHLNEIRRLIESIKNSSVPIEDNMRLAPIVWMKLSMQLSVTGIPIAKSFLRRYGKWRDEHQQQEKLALVVPVTRDGELPNAPEITSNKNGSSIGLALDVFILTDIVDFQKRAWTIQYVTCDVSESAPKNGIQNITNKPKRTTKEVVGAGVYLEVKECIKKAAERQLIRNELRRKPREKRYIYSGTRQDLLERLRQVFPKKLKFSDKVCIQAISEFAACGKYKRSKKSPES